MSRMSRSRCWLSVDPSPPSNAMFVRFQASTSCRSASRSRICESRESPRTTTATRASTAKIVRVLRANCGTGPFRLSGSLFLLRPWLSCPHSDVPYLNESADVSSQASERVDRYAVDADLEVQVWPGGIPRRPDRSDDLPPLDVLIEGHVHGRTVSIERRKSRTVVEDDDNAVAAIP